MGSITPTPTVEKRAAFTLAVVKKAPPTAVKWAPYRLQQTDERRAVLALAVA